MENLKVIDVQAKTGNELFTQNGKNLDFNLLDFWSWSASDILTNTQRGILAEYIVLKDLGIKRTVRTEWGAYDLKMDDGTKIEIKSASYVQSWTQKKLSSISFKIAPTKSWNSETNEYSGELKRQADFYVFCLLNEQNKSKVNPLNLNQWTFYVLPTCALDAHSKTQKTMALSTLEKLKPTPCNFGKVKKTIESYKNAD